MKSKNKKIVASILLVLISFVCFSQTVPPPPQPPVPPGLPIDGGIVMGLISGLCYGVYRLIKSK